MAEILGHQGSENASRAAVRRELNAVQAFLVSSQYEFGTITRGGRTREKEVTFYSHFTVNRAVSWIQAKLTEDPDTENPLVSIDRYVSEAIARHIPRKQKKCVCVRPKKKSRATTKRGGTKDRLLSGNTFVALDFLAKLPSDSTFHDAVKLAQSGFSMFPVWGVTEAGECRCSLGPECKKTGKHPIPRGWRQIATSYLPTLAKFAIKHPHANWGIATGNKMPNGEILSAFDIDERHFGHGSLSGLERLELGPLPVTREHSAGGGPHKFFTYYTGFHSSPGALGQGIDVQSYGRFVVGSGMNARGQRYEVTIDAPIALLPDVWAKYIEAVRRKALPLIPEGQRRTQLIRWAGGMIAEGMDRELILRVLQDRREKRLEKGSHSFADSDLREMIIYCARRQLETRAEKKVEVAHSGRS